MYYPRPRELSDIRRAFEICKRSEHRCKHGSVIRKGSFATIGYNKQKNDPRLVSRENLEIHAEHDALRQHSRAKQGTCIVVRMGNDGESKYSRPCDGCMKRLVAAGVKRVIYSNPESHSGFSELKLRQHVKL